jgi:UDP-N-acetylmuramate--alanine ligase
LLAIKSAPVAVVNVDDENLCKLIQKLKRKPITFSETVTADVRGVITHRKNGCYTLKIFYTGAEFCINLLIPGRYNAKNALAAAAVALTFGIPCEDIKASLEAFSGIERRLEVIGERKGKRIYYDYAHHPTEIKCAIEAVREIGEEKICVVFKPHTYSRTAQFMSEFRDALMLADEVILCDISAIREEEIKGVSSNRLAELIGTKATVLKEAEVCFAIDRSDAGAVIIMGAANLDRVKSDIIGK